MRVRLEAREPSTRPGLGREPEFRRDQLGEPLGVVDVGGGRRRVPCGLRARAGERQRDPARLRRLRVPAQRPLVGPADLEHTYAGLLAPQVRRDHAQEAFERVGAQLGRILRQRVEQLQRARGTQRARPRGIAERVRHALGQPGADERLAHDLLLAAAVAVPRERHRPAPEGGRDPVVAPHPDDFLHEVVLDGEIAAEARHRDVEVGAARAHPEPEAGEDPPRLRGRRGDAEHALHTRHTQAHAHGATLARIDVDHPTRDEAARQLGDELRRAGRGVQQALDVGPALEAISGVGLEVEGARRASGRARIEVRALEEHARGGVGDLAVLAPHDAGQADRALRVGDDAHRGVEGARLAVQGDEALAGARAADDDRRVGHARGVEGVQRMPELPQHVVRHVDHVGDRTQPDGAQP